MKNSLVLTWLFIAMHWIPPYAFASIEFTNVNQVIVNFERDDGLIHPQVSAIEEDQLGFIWLGTALGVTRFDGKNFLTPPVAELRNIDVKHLCSDDNHQLWVGGYRGVHMYNYQLGKYKYFSAQQVIPNDMITALLCVANKVYVGTLESGLYIIDADSHSVTPHSYLSGSRINAIEKVDDSILVASETALFELNPNNDGLFRKLNDVAIRLAYLSELNQLVVAESSGKVSMYGIDSEPWELLWEESVPTKNEIAIKDLKVSKGNIHIVGSDGYYRLNTQGELVESLNSALSLNYNFKDDDMRSLYIDSDSNRWIGSQAHGLYLVIERSKQFGHVNNKTPVNPLQHNVLFNLMLDNQQRLWLSSTRGIMIYVDNHFVRAEALYPELAAYNTGRTSHMFIDGEDVWLATFGAGLLKLSLVDGGVTQYDSVANKPNYINIAKYNDDILVTARQNGIKILDRENRQLRPYFAPKDQAPTASYSMLVIGDELWFTALDGVYRYKDNQLTKLTTGSDFYSTAYYTLALDEYSRIWVGTKEGVLIFNPSGNLEHIVNRSHGLKSLAVWTMVYDRQGSMWLGTSDGLSRVNQRTLQVENYGLLDGIQDLEFNVHTSLLLPDGRVLIGGNNGFNQFYPNQITHNDYIPNLYLSEIHLMGERLLPKVNGIINKGAEYTNNLTLNHDQDVISFHYSSLNYFNDEYQFFHQVEGLSKEWLEVKGNIHQFELLKIPPGEYQINSYIQNSKGVKSDIHTINLTILPPWWWSPLSQSVYFIISLMVALARILAKKREVYHLEQTVAKRTAELTIQKNKLESTLDQLEETQDHLIESEKMAALGGVVAGLAHEINTPLSILKTGASHNYDRINDIESAIRKKQLTKSLLMETVTSQKEGYRLIMSNLERAIDLVESFKNIAVDQSTEPCRELNLKDYIDGILQAFGPVMRRRDIQLKLIGDSDIDIMTYPSPIYQIITNLTNNSLKHGFDGVIDNPAIDIKVERRGADVFITYQDNGVGISKSSQKQIYEPFFTTKRNQGGCGLGMHIVYNLITQVLKGVIDCHSMTNHGVTFTIRFPAEILCEESGLTIRESMRAG